MSIKVCIDPGCDAVWHNCPKAETHCRDCGGRVIPINEETFWKKYSMNWFQYDYPTMNIFRPKKENEQLEIIFPFK